MMNAMITKSTFVRSTYIMREIARSVRASLDTISTPDTMLPVHQNDSVRRMIGCTNRADLGAR